MPHALNPKPKRSSFELADVPGPLQRKVMYGLVGSIAVIMGVVLFWQPAEMTLSCQRTQPPLGVCQLASTGLFGQKVQSFPVESLQGADGQANGKEKFVVLLVDTNRVPMPPTLQQSQVREDRDRINTFVRDPRQTSLLVNQDNRPEAYPKAFTLIMFGSAMLGLAKVS